MPAYLTKDVLIAERPDGDATGRTRTGPTDGPNVYFDETYRSGRLRQGCPREGRQSSLRLDTYVVEMQRTLNERNVVQRTPGPLDLGRHQLPRVAAMKDPHRATVVRAHV